MQRMARTLGLTAALAATVAGCAADGETRRLRAQPLAADHGAVVAAGLALNREAAAKGTAAALRGAAGRDAVLLTPQRVGISDWRPQGAAAAGRWEPKLVALSCDGNSAAVRGAVDGDMGTGGEFVTIWRRDSRGRLAWVLHSEGTSIDPPAAAPPADGDDGFINGQKARCGSRPGVAIEAAAEGDDLAVGLSDDQTLSWTSLVRSDGTRRITVRMWDGAAMQAVIISNQAAPAAGQP